MMVALMAPSRQPNPAATRKPNAQSPPPSRMTVSAVRYWTTDAPTANEMSIPPAMSTTSNPVAKIMLTALWLSRSKRLGSVRNVEVVAPSPTTMAAMTRISRASIEPIPHLRRSGMDVSLNLIDGRGSRRVFSDHAPVAHMQNTVGVEIDFRDLVGDQQDSHTLLGELVDDGKDAGSRTHINPYRGRIQDQQFRIGRQPFGKHDALLIAP